jgi:uncharacterized protein
VTTAQGIRVLSEPECRARLEHAVIGRVAWNTVNGPCVLPVNYRLHRESIVFRTAVDGVLAELAHPRAVAFEVDEYDINDQSGWSVLVSGRTRPASRPDDLKTLWSQADPEPWAGGTRKLFVTLSMDAITGRLLGP